MLSCILGLSSAVPLESTGFLKCIFKSSFTILSFLDRSCQSLLTEDFFLGNSRQPSHGCALYTLFANILFTNTKVLGSGTLLPGIEKI